MLLAKPRWERITLGMVALAVRVGPPPNPDWTLHYVMLAAT